MFIWVVLFLLVLAISFILAYQSMNDYRERPQPLTCGVFLIRNPESLTLSVLNSLRQKLVAPNALISIERLFKGNRQALVVFGPRDILSPFTKLLDLLELEDYSLRVEGQEMAWEVGLKKNQRLNCGRAERLKIPSLEDKEEFWWQLVLYAQQPVNHLPVSSSFFPFVSKRPEGFYANIRVVLKTDDPERKRNLKPELAKVGQEAGLTQLPQTYSSRDLIKFYRERSRPSLGILRMGGFGGSFMVNAEEILCLLGLKR